MSGARIFGDWLLRQMAIADISARGLGRQIGISHQAISKWVGGLAEPEPENVLKLAKYFGADVGELNRMLGRPVGPVRSEELTLPELLRLAQLKAPVYVPVEGVASAGPGAFQESAEGFWLDRTLAVRRRALRVTGDCMAPRIEPGDVVLIDTEASPRPGRIVAATQDGVIIIKRYQGDVLQGDDGSTLPAAGWQLLGVVTNVTKQLV